jgi:uncharacterized protein YegJ (DUF2314 family)
LRFASVFQAFVAVILAVPAVANAQGSAANQVVGVAGDDSAMNAAIAKAHATIGDFVRRLDRPPLSQTDVSLKVRLTDGREVEHVWLADVHHNGTRFWGRISNDVEHLTNYHLGDSVSVELPEVSDWLAVDAGRLVGGYSIRLLRERMSPTERAEFDRQVPFRME